MTAIKQVSVSTQEHVANLTKYLNSDKALLRDSQNLIDAKNWEKEFEQTRQSMGHDKPSRAGSANVLELHQVLAFNPDEADINGGKMSPEMCMDYAREYLATRYGDYEAVFCLHKEECATDKTYRYAVHCAINRSNLVTHKRLYELPGLQGKISRANAVRDMDRKWGLKQLVANERNSRTHARQPTRAEKEMLKRGLTPEKQIIREEIKKGVRELQRNPDNNSVRGLAKKLETQGINMNMSSDSKDFTFRRNGIKVNGLKLGKGFSQAGLLAGLGIDMTRSYAREMDEQERERE